MLDQLGKAGQTFAAGGESGPFGALEKPVQSLGGAGDREYRTEVLGSAVAAGAFEGVQSRRDLRHAGERKSPVRRAEGPRFGGLVETASNEVFLIGGRSVDDGGASGGSARERGNQAEDDVEFQRRPDVVPRRGVVGV